MITQDMYTVTKQQIRNCYAKIEVLNQQLIVVDNFTGIFTDGSISIDANSDIRRTCNISLVVTDSSFEIKPSGKIWLDKYIKIYTGIDNIQTGKTTWFNHGIFLINAPSWNYNGSNNTVSFQGLDLMSKLTGLRNGNLQGLPVIIPQGSNVRDTVISILTQFTDFTKYSISEYEIATPYEIRIDIGGTVYDILKQLSDILPNWQIYFDINGIFHLNKIPTGDNEPIMVDDDIWKISTLNEQVNVDFENVKNVIEVWGKSLKPAHFGEAVLEGQTYNVSMAGVTELKNNLLYGFTIKQNTDSPYLKINDLPSYPIVEEQEQLFRFPQDTGYYIVRYENEKFIFVGFQRPYAIAKDLNPNSPFYIHGALGEIRKVYHNGEFNNIMSNSLCQQRADWELYKATNLQDNLTLTTIPVYWLDVNWLVQYTNKDKHTYRYLIKSINIDLKVGGTQTITMNRYYPYYDYMDKN